MPEEPSTAEAFFLLLGQERCPEGKLPADGIFCKSIIRSPGLWPAVLCRRDPKKEDIQTRDNTPGSFIVSFKSACLSTWSTGPVSSPPVVNDWVKCRIDELTADFVSISMSYILFPVDHGKSLKITTAEFFQLVLPLIVKAEGTVQRLDYDLLHKVHGPQAASSFKKSFLVSPTDFPPNVRDALKYACRARGRSSTNADRSSSEAGQEARGGSRGSRGRGYQGGFRGGRFHRSEGKNDTSLLPAPEKQN